MDALKTDNRELKGRTAVQENEDDQIIVEMKALLERSKKELTEASVQHG